MGMISDFTEAITDSIKSFLADSVKSALDTCNELLIGALRPPAAATDKAPEGQVTGIMDSFLFTNPADFTGSSASDATKIWDIIQKIVDNAVVPIAGAVFAIVVVFDLIDMVMRGNNFHDFDDSIFIKWIIKTVCGIILISNISYICLGILNIGTQVAISANDILFGTGGFATKISTPTISKLTDQSIGYLLVMNIISGFLILGVLITIAFIVVTMASRIIEIFMYVGVSPLPLVSFMNSESKQTGQNWIKNIFALAFQGLFIAIAIGIFLVLFSNSIKNIGNITDMAMLLGYTIALMLTVLRSGQISKSIFNAH